MNENEHSGATNDSSDSPFFIIGCVRSGTTLLRNMLCLHPRLECPAETHLFRWAEPFGTLEYDKNYRRSDLFRRHRLEDGIPNFDFYFSFKIQSTRRQMMDWYGTEYLRRKGNPDGRWFEKTPQHVYNILLLAESYPDARFVHIVRNPLYVVASLLRGEVMPTLELRGAINYWLESAMILAQYRRLAPERLLDIRYEDLLRDPETELTRVLDFTGEQSASFPFHKVTGVGLAKTIPRKRKLRDDYTQYLTPAQIQQVVALTEPYFSAYGYELG